MWFKKILSLKQRDQNDQRKYKFQEYNLYCNYKKG